MTGLVETILRPQVDIHITGEYPLHDSATLRAQLHQWWQWACRGGTWAITHDAARLVDTTLAVQANLGDITITVVNGSGITIGGIYKICHGPNFEFVRVTNIDGTGTVLTLAESLNAQYGSIPGFCFFRDHNYYFGRISDPESRLPIIDVTVQEKSPDVQIPQIRFRLVLDFFETFSSFIFSGFRVELLTGADGSQTTFLLSSTPTVGSLFLFVNGLFQSDYGLNVNQIIFNIPPNAGDEIVAFYYIS